MGHDILQYMNWLVLSYFLSLGTLSYNGQMFTGDHYAGFVMPSPGFQTTLGVELQGLDNHLFVGGSVETWESLYGVIIAPSESLYIFNAGIRGWGFEIGYRHECDHPMISTVDDRASQGFLAKRDEIYLSYTGKLKVF
jgi:hypothetical protein